MKINDANKCGEIFRDGPGIFAFSCTHCNQIFNNSKVILDHIESHFLARISNFSSNNEDEKTQQNDQTKSNNDILECLLFIKEEPPFLETNHETVPLADRCLIVSTKTRKTRSSTKSKISTDPISSNDQQLNTLERQQQSNDLLPSDPFDDSQSLERYPKSKKTQKKSAKEKREKKIPRDTIVNCKICGKAVRADSLKDHSEIHSDELKYTCPVCDKKFKTRLTLRNHKNSHRAFLFNFDPKDLNFMCDICGLIVRTKAVLRLHVRTHTGEKPYDCKICGKAWANSGGLTIHMRSHTGEKPYKCSECDDSFARKPDLDRHKRKNHNTDQRFKCDECDRTFMDSGSLVEHKRIHTGERPYTCEICYRSFSRSKTYRQHKYLHSGEKRYKCKYCDKTFAQSSSCYSHERCFHKKIRRKPKATQVEVPVE